MLTHPMLPALLPALAHFRTEADHAILAWPELTIDFPAQPQRACLVGLRREHRWPVTASAARHIFQPGRQAVDHRHIRDRLAAVVGVLDEERHLVTHQRRLGTCPLEEHQWPLRYVWYL